MGVGVAGSEELQKFSYEWPLVGYFCTHDHTFLSLASVDLPYASPLHGLCEGVSPSLYVLDRMRPMEPGAPQRTTILYNPHPS